MAEDSDDSFREEKTDPEIGSVPSSAVEDITVRHDVGDWMQGFEEGKTAGYMDVAQALLPLLYRVGYTTDDVREYVRLVPIDNQLMDAVLFRVQVIIVEGSGSLFPTPRKKP